MGNTHILPIPIDTIPVHPHTCGEYRSSMALKIGTYGSSPHMWGILFGCPHSRRRSRFIPTHVGNTDTLPDGWEEDSVHPHTCGEYTRDRHAELDGTGSSPHMWGIQGHDCHSTTGVRFIPTHVGNTHSRY